jgi:exonuclease III
MANVHSSEDRILYTKIVDRLIKYVQEGKMRGHEILLLEDFNVNYEDYQKYKIKGISDAYNRKIFHNLEEKYNLFDPVRDIFEISEQNPQHTYFARRGDKEIKTRIDYIWTSEKIYSETKSASIIDVKDIIRTDHRMLIIEFFTEQLFGINMLENNIPKELKK